MARLLTGLLSGPALRRAWVGYQVRLDAEMAAAGFADRGFPDGRVLRLSSKTPDLTAARLGRELGISRQGAGKIVADLRERGYIELRPSPQDAREKTIHLTERGTEYLATQRSAARRIQQEIREALGEDAWMSLQHLLDFLGADPQAGSLRSYLQRALSYRGPSTLDRGRSEGP